MKPVKCRRMRGDMQDYTNQMYIAHLLDEQRFDMMNKDSGDDITYLYSDGLDAPDFMPTGSMKNIDNHYYDRSICERGVSLARQLEIDKMMDELIDEVLNEKI
jgi:hypothetical protein